MITYKQRIKEAAAKADLTPRAVNLLNSFFMEHSTKEERDELDIWMNESEANSNFFDLMVEVNMNGVGISSLALMMKLAKREPRKKSKYRRYIYIGLLVLLGIVILDQVIPSHPVHKLIFGNNPPKHDLLKVTVSTDGESKTMLLPDSSSVEILPHSSIRYQEDFYWGGRLVEVTGSAIFKVRKNNDLPFRVELGDAAVETTRDAIIRGEGGKLTVE